MRALLIAGIVALTIVAVVASNRRKKEHYLIYPYLDMAEDGYNGNPYALMEEPPLFTGPKDSFSNVGPYNLQLYDYPYQYPTYAARNGWDVTSRCRTNCGDNGCSVWCR